MSHRREHEEKESKSAHKHSTLFNLCRMMSAERDLNTLLDFLVKNAVDVVDADRATIFLFDEKRNELWSKVAMGITDVIRFDAELGIAGEVLKWGKVVNVEDAYRYPKFNPQVDKKTGYTTKAVICVPMKNISGRPIGVLQALNKKDGVFSKEDEEVLEIFAFHAAIAIENAKFIGELEGSKSRLQQENVILREKVRGKFFVSNIAGASPRIREIVKLIEKIADSPLNVLITGESGTGKELAARTIHYNSSRSEKPFIDINCAALPESLLESELFGIEKGVATGVERREGKIEMANGGTLFLDEIGDMSLPAQAKLLRVLQERKLERVGGRKTIPVDVRVLAATNKNLEDEIKKENFRNDLYYRLNVVHIDMPPLREMQEDIPLLAKYFLNNFTSELGRETMRFSSDAMDCLVDYRWPGNIRELENEVKRAAIMADGDVIRESDLSDHIRGASKNSRGVLQYATAEIDSTQSLRETVEEIEIRMIKDALQESRGNKQKASEILGITRQGLIKKMKRYGLS
ncbi:MAG TPA: sigma 54-interacting transcriptional regulator [Thermodesulfobacteriota bacterium]|nr:sigma 54-interacting transcriptional regulator [Thermodesulfobacteriota bacterium]